MQLKKSSLYIFSFTLVLFLSFPLNAQDKKENKLDKVKGEVQKITIQTDKGTFTFEGNDAKEIYKKMQPSNIMRYRVFTDGDDDDVFFLGKDKMDKDFSFFTNEMKDGKKVEIKIDKKDGEKTVTVTTTNKDGESETKTYTGKEADEYLEKHGEKNLRLKWIGKNHKGKVFFIKENGKDSVDIDSDIMMWNPDSSDAFRYFIDKDSNGIKEMIKVKDDNGEKKVTVTTTDKDGKETTETYEGKEAEEYLKKHNVKVKVEGDKDGVVKEIIIKKKNKKDED